MILYVSLFSIITSAIIAIYNWRINQNALLLTGIFGIFSTYGLTHYFTVYQNDVFWTAIFYGNLSPLWYLPGPLLYLYTRNTITDKSLFSSKKDLLHLVPFLIQAINLAPYLFSSFDHKLETARLILNDINQVRSAGAGLFIPPSISFVTRPLLIIIYACTSFFLLYTYNRKERKNLESNKQNKLVYNWLMTLIIVTLIVSANFLFMTLELYDAPVNRVIMESEPTYTISGIAFALLPLALIVFFPQVLYGMPLVTSVKKSAKITIPLADSTDPLAETAQIIVDYIKQEKPYLYPDFDIEDIAERLDIPKHHIIYCFTIILQKKFTAYRSTVRIEHAKELLKAGTADTLSIDGIGAQSGFSSRSGFYATFKAETGMTPSQYLENLA
jgi:AraC-like DNA-binding protein